MKICRIKAIVKGEEEISIHIFYMTKDNYAEINKE